MPTFNNLTFKSVDETLVCDHAIEQYFHEVLFVMLYKVVLLFQVCGRNRDHSNKSY